MDSLMIQAVDTADVALSAQAFKYLKQYENAVKNLTRSAWNVANVVNKTVNAKDFIESFGTLENYSAHIGVTTGQISRWNRSVSVYNLLVEANTEYSAFTPGQIQELLPISKDVIVDELVKANNITPATPAKQIREVVKRYKQLVESAEEESTESAEEESTESADVESETVESVNNHVICEISIGGDRWEFDDEDKIRMTRDFLSQIFKED